MPPTQEPNGLLLFLLCLAAAAGLIGLLKLNHWWVTRKSFTPQEEEAGETLTVAAPIMSRTSALATPKEPAGNPVAGNAPAAGQRMAKPGNAVNDELPGNMVPEEVREIMRFQAKVEAVEAILKSGKIGQVEAIESVFECKRSGRPESVYARAVGALKARSDAAYRERQARLEQIRSAE